MKREIAGPTIRFLILATLSAAGAISCAPTSPEGSLALTSKTANPLRLDARFTHGAYAVEPAGVSMIMSTVSLEDLRTGDFENAQVVDIRVMWDPIAGRTPVSKESTNLIIRHVVLVGEEAGIYGGGGFGWPQGTPGETGFGLEITGSSVALVDSTEGFLDPFSPATLLGTIGGPLDAATTVGMRDAISQLVTNRLGRTRWVRYDPGESDHDHG